MPDAATVDTIAGRISWFALFVLWGCGGPDSGALEAGQSDLVSEHSARALYLASTDQQFLTLSVYSGSPFAFYVKAPLENLAAGEEIEFADSAGWELGFSALLPAEEDPLEPGYTGPEGTGATCVEGTHNDVVDGVKCLIPYVGYGTDDLVTLQIKQESASAVARVYFHSVDTTAGAQVTMEYLFMVASPAAGGGCVLFLDYSREPVVFVVGQSLESSMESSPGACVAGPVFPIDFRQDELPGQGEQQDCTLDRFPELFVDFCPVEHGAGAGEPGSYWGQKCAQQYPSLAAYPNP